jgi:prepilin-type N-terminal cleavage/methylation domain-containing protein
MTRNRQRGMTLIELLVAMAVTSILLLGLGTVFFNVTNRYQDWAHRLQTASVGASLAANLQADSHRYGPCNQTQLSAPLLDLALCAEDQPSTAVVTYHVTGSGPWVVTRQQGGAATFMLRSDTQPDFWIDCRGNGSTVSGHIHVYNLRSPNDSLDSNPADAAYHETFSVYYVAPQGNRSCP